MLIKYSLLCASLFTYYAFIASEAPVQDFLKDQINAAHDQHPVRALASILKRLKVNAQETLNNLHDHMHYNSKHQSNNSLVKQSFPYNVIETIARHCASHKDIDWLKTKQDKDQRVIINLEALQPVLADPQTSQELAHIINDLQKDQEAITNTLESHKRINDTIFYGLPLVIFYTTYYNSSKEDRLINALGCSTIFGPIAYYFMKHKDIGSLSSDVEQRALTIQDLQRLTALLPKTNDQHPSNNNNQGQSHV